MPSHIDHFIMPIFSDEEMDSLLDNVRAEQESQRSTLTTQLNAPSSNPNWPTVARKLPPPASRQPVLKAYEAEADADYFEIVLATPIPSSVKPAPAISYPQTTPSRKEVEVTRAPIITTTKLAALPSTARPEVPTAWNQELRTLSSTIVLAAKNQKQQSFLICDVTPEASSEAITRGLGLALSSAWNSSVLFCSLQNNLNTTDPSAVTAMAKSEPMYLRMTGHPNLHELATSRGEVAMADLIIRYDLQMMLAQLKQEFDLVLFNAPSISTNAEIDLLAAQVDAVILVVRPGITTKAEVQKVQTRLQNAKANILGAVLHQSK